MKKIWIIIFILILTGCVNSNPTTISKDKETTVEDKMTISIDDQSYTYDVVSHATNGTKEGPVYTGIEKENLMFWSGRPKVGLIEGDFYQNSFIFDGNYIAYLTVVKDLHNDEILMAEFDELTPDNYYSSQWQGQTKRLSGYANWQMENPRTDVTLVTVVNAMNLLEYQIVNENRLKGDFYTPVGASNSGRNGYIPLANIMAEEIKEESLYNYKSITQNIENGLTARLSIVFEKSTSKIIDISYDEYFPDYIGDIENEGWLNYLRQSKYHSPLYNQNVEHSFKNYVNELKKEIIDLQSFAVEIDTNIISPSFIEMSKELYE